MLQHYIPKFILEGFVNESALGNRGVWVYHATYKSWQKRSTKRTASLDDFYSFIEDDGERDDAVEEMLQGIETPSALLLRKDIGQRLPIAGPPHRDDLFITFCSLLIARNPATIDRTKAVVARSAQQWLDEITESAESFQAFREEYRKTLGVEFPNVIDFRSLRAGFNITTTKSGGLGVSLAMSRAFADKLAAMDVDFLFAPSSGPAFVTADVPYLIIGMPQDPTVFDQVIIPLSAEVTAVFNASDDPRYDYVDATPGVARSINRAMLLAAHDMIISRTPDAFSKTMLDAWAAADSNGREEIVKEFAHTESGA